MESIIDKINDRILKLKFFNIPIINKIYLKIMNKEILLYLIFGLLATVISIFSFWLCSYHIFNFISNENINITLSQIFSFVIAVLFAFFTNKNLVFEAKTSTTKDGIKQFISFISARLLTFAIEYFGILLFVNILYINKMISKVIFNIIVIILNYIFSKLFIFKK